MKVLEIVFSPTGGTKRAADILVKEWGLPVEEIDLTDARADYAAGSPAAEDIAVIALPSFSGRAPALAAERLAQVHGNGAMCVLVCVYGNRAYEDTLVEMSDIAEGCGFRVVAAVAAVAEHSIARQYAAGRPDAADEDSLRGFARQIWDKINGDADSIAAPQIPGNRPYRKAGGSGMTPKAGKECVKCGLCARDCPAQAISKDDPQKTDGDKCISCMRCVARCPQGARKLNGALTAAVALKLKKVCSDRKDNELHI